MTLGSVNTIAVIDDTPGDGFRLAFAARRIGGYEPTLFSSTSSFLAKHDTSIMSALQQNKAIICDNNFQSSDRQWGHEFLLNTVGPALAHMPEANRPLVVCFSPSSWEVIREHQEQFKQFGIISLHKQDQIGLIGLALRISTEGIIRPSSEFVQSIIDATTEDHASLFFTNDLAPQIYDDFLHARSFANASAMIEGILPCSLAELRTAAMNNFGPAVAELLNAGLPPEGSMHKIER